MSGVNDPMGGVFSGDRTGPRAHDRATGNINGLGGGGSQSNGPSGSTGGSGRGYTPNGVPVSPNAGPQSTPLPHIPDVDGGAEPQAPVDLSLLAGPQDLPQRRPLTNAAVSIPQTGVTGYAGQV